MPVSSPSSKTEFAPSLPATSVVGRVPAKRHSRSPLRVGLYLGLLPAILIAAGVYVFTIVWTVGISFTGSKMLPVAKFAGISQYVRLFGSDRWPLALLNMVIFGVGLVVLSLVLGFLLAVALDQKVRFEGVFRTIFLYPYAMSFIVTGLIWQWILNPGLGLQKVANDLGFPGLRLDWVAHQETAIYCVVAVGVWHAAGLVMAIMLAGLRGIDPDLWKATKVEGIATWRVYVHIIVPIMKPSFTSATVLLLLGVVKLYDLVIALTGGGPGISTDVPALFIMDNLFQRQNIGLAAAGATVVLVIVLLFLVPWLYHEYGRPRGARRAA